MGIDTWMLTCTSELIIRENNFARSNEIVNSYSINCITNLFDSFFFFTLKLGFKISKKLRQDGQLKFY